ncbi:MAG TPA: dihydroneopterin aldolase [Verrucomicrobiae bacterium]|nr:dihydroneopterin aldolase [Verrucomicrobiae bacterium]
MDTIVIKDLEVFYHVGVPEEERAAAQRLLITAELSVDVSAAIASDDVTKTIDYHAVVQRLVRFGEGRSWRLIERLADDIARMILEEFGAGSVSVEVKKFILPETRYVAVRLARKRAGRGTRKIP